MSDIILIAHNIRSTYNVGSIFRTCDGFGVTKLILSGYTPYPSIHHDTRLPHIAEKLTEQIHKTALGAEKSLPFEYIPELDLYSYKEQGYTMIALEQSSDSIPLQTYTTAGAIALLLGEEVHGVPSELLSMCDTILEIPMQGSKESFNVSVAAGIALYALTTQ